MGSRIKCADVDVDNWPSQLEAKLKEAGGGKKGDDILLTSVIDSGGGDIMGKVGRTLRKGGKVVVYGMCVL